MNEQPETDRTSACHAAATSHHPTETPTGAPAEAAPVPGCPRRTGPGPHMRRQFHLFAVATRANGTVRFEEIAHTVFAPEDNVGDFNRRRHLITWAQEQLHKRFFDVGLYCVEFSAVDPTDDSETSIDSQYFTWGGIGPVVDAYIPYDRLRRDPSPVTA